MKTKTYKLKTNVLVVNVLCELTFQTQIREKYFWQLSYIITKLSLILKRAKFSFHIYVCISTLFKQRLISINSASPSLCDSVCMYVQKRKWTNVKTKETFTARERNKERFLKLMGIITSYAAHNNITYITIMFEYAK